MIPGTVTVRSKQETQLKSDVGGRVAESFLEIGVPVMEGEILVQLDTGDIEIELNRLKNELDAIKRKIEVGSQTRYNLIDAQEKLEGSERLFTRGSLSEAEFEKQKRNVQQIQDRIALEELQNQQQLDKLENQLMVSERQKGKMTIRAPIDCIIADVFAFRGDLIGGGAPIAAIISPVKVVEARISQEDMAGLTIGQKSSVRFLGYGDELYNAEVVKILPVADADTQRYVVHLGVEVDPDRLIPGITGEVGIVLDQRENAIVIPRRSLIGDEVYIVNDGVVEVRTVTRGFVGLNNVEIVEGIAEGEWVVTSNYDRLRSGDRIRISED
jgi:RND family efflux transporter MFP subunit